METLRICSTVTLPVAAMLAVALPSAAHAEGFDGPYAGITGGLGIVKAKGSTLAGPFDESDSSAIVTGVAGFRSPIGGSGLVVGVEGDAGVDTDSGDLRYGASALAGFTITDSSLLYGRVGYAGRDGFPAGAGDGIMFGGGFETKLAKQANLRLDYKYLDLGSIDIVDNTAKYTGHEITAGVIFTF